MNALRKVFNHFDRNSDGKLEKAEFCEIVHHLGKGRGEGYFDFIEKTNELIDFQEFEKGLRQLYLMEWKIPTERNISATEEKEYILSSTQNKVRNRLLNSL